jgi:hypothetical protein
MKDHEKCAQYQLFMRNNDHPNRYPFFVYGGDQGYYKLRFKWKEKEVAARVSLKGRRILSIGEIIIGGFCENTRIVNNTLVENIVPIEPAERDAVSDYILTNPTHIYDGLRRLLSTTEHSSMIKKERLKENPIFFYRDYDGYKMNFDWNGKDVACKVYLAGTKDLRIGKVVVEGISGATAAS